MSTESNQTYLLLCSKENVTPTLNVSKKFSMCIIFSTGYIKIYNLKSSNEYHIQQITFVHQKLPFIYPII